MRVYCDKKTEDSITRFSLKSGKMPYLLVDRKIRRDFLYLELTLGYGDFLSRRYISETVREKKRVFLSLIGNHNYALDLYKRR